MSPCRKWGTFICFLVRVWTFWNFMPHQKYFYNMAPHAKILKIYKGNFENLWRKFWKFMTEIFFNLKSKILNFWNFGNFEIFEIFQGNFWKFTKRTFENGHPIGPLGAYEGGISFRPFFNITEHEKTEIYL